MKRLLLVLMLAGCAPTAVHDSSHIKEADVVMAMDRHGVVLDEGTDAGIFASRLEGVKPKVYEVDGRAVVIYEFDSVEQRVASEKAFTDLTASMNLVSYSVMVNRNVLVFYVHGEDLGISEEVPFAEEIRDALESLVEG